MNGTKELRVIHSTAGKAGGAGSPAGDQGHWAGSQAAYLLCSEPGQFSKVKVNPKASLMLVLNASPFQIRSSGEIRSFPACLIAGADLRHGSDRRKESRNCRLKLQRPPVCFSRTPWPQRELRVVQPSCNQLVTNMRVVEQGPGRSLTLRHQGPYLASSP